MEQKKSESYGKFVSRHVAQLKVLSRLMEHELDSTKEGASVALDRDLMESMVDTLEIFIEDIDTGGARRERGQAEKPAVARLN